MGLMNIKFNDNEIELQQLQDVFNEKNPPCPVPITP